MSFFVVAIAASVIISSYTDITTCRAFVPRTIPFSWYHNKVDTIKHQSRFPTNNDIVTDGHSSSLFLAGGGFGSGIPRKKSGGGGFKSKKGGSSKNTKSAATSTSTPTSTANAKKVQAEQKKLLDKYGGDIARGTSERIRSALDALPPHIREAAELYKRVQQWDSHVSGMSVLQQSSIRPQDFERAKVASDKLQSLYEQYDITPNDMHNLYQRITWDASADAKASRAITGRMSSDVETRIDRACTVLAGAVKAGGSGSKGRCLDVGCGPGVLVPYLIRAGLLPNQIHGIDLSPEMIRNAQKAHRGVHFTSADFLTLQHDEDADGYEGIIFCSALHDFPDPFAALAKASQLLRPNGKLVVVHAQGASHVMGQVRSNPILVKRPLPTAQELEGLDVGLRLEHAPAEPGSSEDSEEGYLAVLVKVDTGR